MGQKKTAALLIASLHLIALPSSSQSRGVPSVRKGHQYERTFSLSGAPILILENTSVRGNIEVLTWSHPEIKVVAEIHSPNTHIEASPADGVLKVRLKRAGMVSSEPVHFRVWVPPTCEVEVSTMGGSITVRGVRARLKALTTEGNILLQDVSGHNVDAISSTNGNITLSSRFGGEGKYNLYSAAGHVNVLFPEPASFVLDAATREGRIDVNGFQLRDQRRSDHHLRGTYGTGEVILILRTYRGVITLRRQ